MTTEKKKLRERGMNKATQVVLGVGRKMERKETDNEQQKEKSREISHFQFLFFSRAKITKAAQTKKCTGGGRGRRNINLKIF